MEPPAPTEVPEDGSHLTAVEGTLDAESPSSAEQKG
ncbi:hypothetical protein SSBG_04731 [Streptomyces sp. SPB074]|nr:hypothetical protein SSBG_04731 [Streptomyces sp. SPB074]